MSQRSWQAISGFLSVVFITHFLSPELQGWYYSFLSIAAFHTLFDLGLSVVLVQVSAHLFIELRWLSTGRRAGENEGRFRGLVIWSFRHYALLSFFYLGLLMPGGWLFFAYHPRGLGLDVVWLAPWGFLVLFMALSILAVPFFSLIEGSGRVNEVYMIRLLQGVLGAIGCWVVLASGGGLWAAVMPSAFGVVVGSAWLQRYYPSLLRDAFSAISRECRWGEAVWPLQWRVGLSWMSGYLLTQIYTPILFNCQGAIVAGQMGLTLTVANMLGLVAQSWIVRHVPAMVQAVSGQKWGEFDRMFRRDFIFSTSVYLAGAAFLCFVRILISNTSYDGRVLSFLPFVGLLFVVFFNHIVGALATHLRSYTREPLVWVTVFGSLLTVPLAIWAAIVYSAGGVVVAILGVQLFFIFPISVRIWRKCNIEWRV